MVAYNIVLPSGSFSCISKRPFVVSDMICGLGTDSGKRAANPFKSLAKMSALTNDSRTATSSLSGSHLAIHRIKKGLPE